VAYDPNIRASDADRDKAATLLREHHAAGRLTPEEFSERLDKVFAAKTVGDIDSQLRDLPSIDMYRLPDAALTRHPRQVSSRRRHAEAWRAAWGGWLCVTLVCIVIWALSGLGYPWWLWVAGPWGAIMVGRWVTGSHPQGGQPSVHGSDGQEQGQLPRGDEDLPGRAGH